MTPHRAALAAVCLNTSIKVTSKQRGMLEHTAVRTTLSPSTRQAALRERTSTLLPLQKPALRGNHHPQLLLSLGRGLLFHCFIFIPILSWMSSFSASPFAFSTVIVSALQHRHRLLRRLQPNPPLANQLTQLHFLSTDFLNIWCIPFYFSIFVSLIRVVCRHGLKPPQVRNEVKTGLLTVVDGHGDDDDQWPWWGMGGL